MNKAWITALSIAGIAGSASAAYAGLSVSGNEGAPAEAQGLDRKSTRLNSSH